MARRADPIRKWPLIGEMVDVLFGRPLTADTFRAIAAGLGSGTFTLVYHFE